MRHELNSEELEAFIEHHRVFYIRHDFDSTEEAYRKLISEGLIAVHYGGELEDGVDATDPKNRDDPANFKDNARRVLTRFKQCCRDGAIVFADYSNPPVTTIQKEANIGIIPEGTNYEAVTYYGHEKYPEGLIYEQARLNCCREFSYADIEPFLAIHPRGGTLVHWEQAEKLVKFVYRKRLGLLTNMHMLDFSMLFPAQQEVLCSEFLRTKAPEDLRLSYLLLPVGRGMKTFDIDGANERTYLMGQVSFSTAENEIIAKISEMESLVAEDRTRKGIVLVYFGPEEARRVVTKVHSRVRFFSLEEVFAAMKETGILEDMLGVSG